jgi:tRNA dimethylallyltransferase
MKNNKIIVILGQTSTGKSDFAVEVARQINGLNQSGRLIARTSRSEVLGEIISADSRQVYKGMNLGTGKITKKEMRGIPHHLLDITSPSKIFTVSDFQKLVNKKIKEIMKRNKIPIICGGTGFYIDSIINGTVFPNVKPNKKLRKILEGKTTEKLFQMLEKLDSIRAKNIDSKNKVRLIRAIEIAKALGKVPALNNNKNIVDTNSAMAEFVSTPNFQFLKIGLTIPPEILKVMIKNRLLKRIKKGMIKEVENLHRGGLSWKRMNSLGLEYRYVSIYLQKKLSKEEMIEKLNTEIWHFAKRQKTWFKRDQNITWINPLKKSEKLEAQKEIKRFLK